MYLRGVVETVSTGVPVPDGTQGEMRLLSDNTLVTTLETTDGWFEYEQNGNPGPFKITWDAGTRVRNQYSKITGPSASTDIGSLPLIFRTFTNGVISGVGSDLAATASGSDMNVSVAIGAALAQGILYDRITSGNLAVSAAHATLARIDTIVVEVVPTGAGEDIEGRAELKIVAGTAAASPAAPTLTQTSSLYQYPIYNVLVGAAVVVIGSDKLTDRRTYARTTIPAGGVGTTELADGSVTTGKLADNSVTSAKIVNGTITGDDIANLTITGPNLAFGSVTSLHISNGTIVTADIADSAITSDKLAANAVTGAKLNDNIITQYMLVDGAVVTAKIADGAVTSAKLAATGTDILMPVSEYVATGGISSGTRTLVTLGVGPLTNGVTYAIQVTHGLTIRNSGTTGTVNVRCNIDGGTQRTHEFQNVGGVPRWCPVTQSAEVVGDGGSIDVTGSVSFVSGNTSDIRAGEISVIAIPHPVMVGA